MVKYRLHPPQAGEGARLEAPPEVIFFLLSVTVISQQTGAILGVPRIIQCFVLALRISRIPALYRVLITTKPRKIYTEAHWSDFAIPISNYIGQYILEYWGPYPALNNKGSTA